MSDIVIRAENIWKEYNLGVIGYGSLRAELQSWWAKKRNLDDPNTIIGQDKNRRSDRFYALQDVSFEIKRGEVMGIIGRNGAGKSTLLKILSRLTAPTRGSLMINGKVASLLEVGTGFHPELTGRENVYLNGAILGMTEIEIKKKFDEIVAFAGVEKFIDTPVKRYSSGMYVRLAFAVGAHLDSEILIVDEVLAVGDIQFQKKCMKKLQEVQNAGRTILFVSHGPEVVKKLCNRCLWLEQGVVKGYGLSDLVVADYVGMTLTTSDSLPDEHERPLSPVIDLSSYKSKHGNNEVCIESIEMLNAVNNAFCSPWDEPIRLKLKVKFNQAMEKISFGIGIATIDDIPVMTVRSTDTDGSFNAKGGQTYEVEVNVNHSLRAGKYVLHLGVLAGEDTCYYNPELFLDISKNGKMAYREGNTGIINCNADWWIK